MHTHNTHSSLVAVLDSHSAATQPSTIPPGPASGVTLRAAVARTDSPPPSSALPCASFWPAAAATLRSSQVLSAAADEVDWLYENTDDETEPECVRARATIEAWLSELSFEHQLTIALHHDATPWPEELAGHEKDAFALILHALCPSTARDFECYSPAARAPGHRSAYEWQYSLDQKTCTAMPVTLQAKTDISGLTSGTTYAFRFRPVLKAGEATWSQVVVQLIQ